MCVVFWFCADSFQPGGALFARGVNDWMPNIILFFSLSLFLAHVGNVARGMPSLQEKQKERRWKTALADLSQDRELLSPLKCLCRDG